MNVSVDPRDPAIEYKWCDVGVLDYSPSNNLYLVQKVKDGQVSDLEGRPVVNGGKLPDGLFS